MAADFLDTNVFLRHFTEADPAQAHLVRQAEQSRGILHGLAAGTRVATTCEGVIVEIVQVLSSKNLYNVPGCAHPGFSRE
jgi:predicted nucleic acid-binding protein